MASTTFNLLRTDPDRRGVAAYIAACLPGTATVTVSAARVVVVSDGCQVGKCAGCPGERLVEIVGPEESPTLDINRRVKAGECVFRGIEADLENIIATPGSCCEAVVGTAVTSAAGNLGNVMTEMRTIIGRVRTEGISQVLDHGSLVDWRVAGGFETVTVAAETVNGSERRVMGVAPDAVAAVMVIGIVGFVIVRTAKGLAGTVLVLTGLVVADTANLIGAVFILPQIITIDTVIVGCDR